MIFYRISELMLPILIQRYDEKSFHFLSNPKTRDAGSQMPHFMFVLKLHINLLNLSWKKMSIFEEFGAFNIEYIFIIWNKCIIRYNIATYITP